MCVVCHGQMEDGEMTVALKCDHVFHLNCVLPWLKTRSTCPLCRANLVTAADIAAASAAAAGGGGIGGGGLTASLPPAPSVITASKQLTPPTLFWVNKDTDALTPPPHMGGGWRTPSVSSRGRTLLWN